MVEGPRPALCWVREAIMQYQLSASRKQLIAERAWYRVVHIPAEIIMRQLPLALAKIRAALGQLP